MYTIMYFERLSSPRFQRGMEQWLGCNMTHQMHCPKNSLLFNCIIVFASHLSVEMTRNAQYNIDLSADDANVFYSLNVF